MSDSLLRIQTSVISGTLYRHISHLSLRSMLTKIPSSAEAQQSVQLHAAYAILLVFFLHSVSTFHFCVSSHQDCSGRVVLEPGLDPGTPTSVFALRAGGLMHCASCSVLFPSLHVLAPMLLKHWVSCYWTCISGTLGVLYGFTSS